MICVLSHQLAALTRRRTFYLGWGVFIKGLWLCPRTAVTNYHMLGAFKQQKQNLAQKGDQRSESKVVAEPCSLGRL